jgi:hypothetical protein
LVDLVKAQDGPLQFRSSLSTKGDMGRSCKIHDTR